MYFIEEGLYQGPRPKALHPTITAIINLEAMEDGAFLHDDLTDVSTARIMLPIYDADYPGHKWLTMAVKIVEALREAGHVVYIHCRGGISRSAMLTAAVLMKKHGWDLDKAMNHIAGSNATVDANPRFMRGLKDWKPRG
jgi:protein-tyrosine phosphatase